jgi:holliday junction DNA helicase RuvA
MIALVTGRLASRGIDRVELMTSGGVGYEIAIPLGVYEHLPPVGNEVSLYTHLVVKEDGWQLYGFSAPTDRAVFRAVLGAKGIGPALALALLSSLTSTRLVRAIQEKDFATLQAVPRVGRKKAEQMVLDLADKLDGLVEETPAPRTGIAVVDDAARGLVSLGYSRADADRAIRAALEAGASPAPATDLIRAALRQLGGR